MKIHRKFSYIFFISLNKGSDKNRIILLLKELSSIIMHNWIDIKLGIKLASIADILGRMLKIMVCSERIEERMKIIILLINIIVLICFW